MEYYIGTNAKEMYEFGYLDENNCLRKYSGTNPEIIQNVKEGSINKHTNRKYSFLTTSNELYVYEDAILTKKADDVKTACRVDYYLNNDNELYNFYDSLIATDVKVLFYDGSYLLNDGELSIYGESYTDLHDVVDYIIEKNQVVTSDGKHYYNDILVKDSGMNWYQALDGKIYYYAYAVNDITW